MSIGICVHVEDGNKNGIWPSHLDELRLFGHACGVDRWALIDQTTDGYFGNMGDSNADIQRHRSLAEFEAAVGRDTIIALEAPGAIEARGLTPADMDMAYRHPTRPNVWYVVGPAAGFPAAWIDNTKTWLFVQTEAGIGVHSLFVVAWAIVHRYYGNQT